MKFMTVREFMRGGYKLITEPTIVSSHGRPIFTVMPSAGADNRTTVATVREPERRPAVDIFGTKE